jgi:hypothetical protein
VRHFAETSDLVLFFFDPDKPGTTGETVSIFTETLAGLEYKLLIVMNKVDLFENIRDFARTYGTLCWNLAKTIKTKDIPHIFNTFVPTSQTSAARGIRTVPLNDFEQSRQEVIAEIQRTPSRRADNLVSDLYNNARKLSVHTRICYTLADRYRCARNKAWGLIGLIALVAATAVWFSRNAESWTTPLVIALTGLAAAAAAWYGSLWYLRRLRQSFVEPEHLDDVFHHVYRRELTLRDRADVRALWESVKKQTARTFQVLGAGSLNRAYSTRKHLKRLDQVVAEEIPSLRRAVDERLHRNRPERAEAIESEESSAAIPGLSGSEKRPAG